MEYFNTTVNNLALRVSNGVPGVLGAILFLILGWIVAAIVRRIVLAIFRKTRLDERFGEKYFGTRSAGKNIATGIYYFILLIVFLAVLEMVGVNGVLHPLTDLLGDFLGFIPNLVAALLIGLIGYVIAKFISESVGFLGASLQNYLTKSGMDIKIDLVNVVKKVVFVIIFVPLLIAALDALQMEAISDPATRMFDRFLAAIPQILSAGIIIAVFYFVGRFVTGILTSILAGMGIDLLAEPLGINRMTSMAAPVSTLIGRVAFFFIMFAGIIAGAEKLELAQLTTTLNDIFEISGRILFGVVLFFVGNWLSTLAQNALSAQGSTFLGSVARFAVLFIFLALGLNAMGIADEIVNLAFGLTIGAVAVAVALAYGLGGREAAGKHAEDILRKFRNKE